MPRVIWPINNRYNGGVYNYITYRGFPNDKTLLNCRGDVPSNVWFSEMDVDVAQYLVFTH